MKKEKKKEEEGVSLCSKGKKPPTVAEEEEEGEEENRSRGKRKKREKKLSLSFLPPTPLQNAASLPFLLFFVFVVGALPFSLCPQTLFFGVVSCACVCVSKL